MTPQVPPSFGSYLSTILLFAIGVLALLFPTKLLGSKGTAEERAKLGKRLRICGACMIAGAFLKVYLHAR